MESTYNVLLLKKFVKSKFESNLCIEQSIEKVGTFFRQSKDLPLICIPTQPAEINPRYGKARLSAR